RHEGVHPGHAHQAWLAVHLGAAGPALAGLAVPAYGEISRLGRLDGVDHVQHHHALLAGHAVFLEGASRDVAPPYTHDDFRRGHHFRSLRSSFNSAGISGSGSWATPRTPSLLRITTLTLPNRSSANG